MNRLARGQLNTRSTAVPHENAPQLETASHFTPMLDDVRYQTASQAGGPVHSHLGHGSRREQGRDRVAETPQTEIHFAQTIEEKQAGAHGVVLEVARNEFERGQRGGFQQPSSQRGMFQQLAA